MASLGLPDGIRACLFDLDGVLTRTARLHARAWKEMFDEFLLRLVLAAAVSPSRRSTTTATTPSTSTGGHGATAPARSWPPAGSCCPRGNRTTRPGVPTVHGLSNRKNASRAAADPRRWGQVYPGSLTYLRAVTPRGAVHGCGFLSANTLDVLRVTGLEPLFDVRIDGVVAGQRHLAGKPAPDTFLAGAAALGVTAGESAVFEDALAGVEAGHARRFRPRRRGRPGRTGGSTPRARGRRRRPDLADLLTGADTGGRG